MGVNTWKLGISFDAVRSRLAYSDSLPSLSGTSVLILGSSR